MRERGEAETDLVDVARLVVVDEEAGVALFVLLTILVLFVDLEADLVCKNTMSAADRPGQEADGLSTSVPCLRMLTPSV